MSHAKSNNINYLEPKIPKWHKLYGGKHLNVNLLNKQHFIIVWMRIVNRRCARYTKATMLGTTDINSFFFLENWIVLDKLIQIIIIQIYTESGWQNWDRPMDKYEKARTNMWSQHVYTRCVVFVYILSNDFQKGKLMLCYMRFKRLPDQRMLSSSAMNVHQIWTFYCIYIENFH